MSPNDCDPCLRSKELQAGPPCASNVLDLDEEVQGLFSLPFLTLSHYRWERHPRWGMTPSSLVLRYVHALTV